VEASGQPLFRCGEGGIFVRRELRSAWAERRDGEMRERGHSWIGHVGEVATLDKRKGVKVVPVDENHAAGKRPMGIVCGGEGAGEREEVLEMRGGGREVSGVSRPLVFVD
jgi:hypothetical protein